jgi:hypothetical protein
VAGFIGYEPVAGARRNSILHNFIAKAFVAWLYDKRPTSAGPKADHIYVITTTADDAYYCGRSQSFALKSSDHPGH